MESEMDHEAAVRHKMLTNFTPIKPVEADAAARELTEQVVMKNSTADGFACVLLKQWREDTSSSPRRDTWGVVGTALEAGLVYRDLEGGHISDGSSQAIPEGQLATPDTYEAGKGQLIITSFEKVAEVVLVALAGRTSFPENVSAVLNFGYGSVTFAMAVVSTSLVRLIRNSLVMRNNTLAVCTVCNSSTSFFGRGWPPRMVHEIGSEEANMDRYEWRTSPAGAGGEQQPQEGDGTQSASDHFKKACQAKRGEKRMVLLMDLPRDLALEIGEDSHIRWQRHSSEHWVYDSKHELQDRAKGANIAVNTGIDYIGPIKNVGRVLIHKHVRGFVYDSRNSHMVMKYYTRRSKSEIEYAGRLHGAAEPPPQIYCDMTLPEFQGSPHMPSTSPAHTADLPRLLLVYIHTWAGAGLPVADMPVTLPTDEYTVEEQLRRLAVKGLVKVLAPPSKPHGAVGRRLLYSALGLTTAGKDTAVMILYGNIESIHVAHLLAQVVGGNAQATDVVEDAALNIASVLETAEGATKLAGIVDTRGSSRQTLGDFKSRGLLQGGAAPSVGRGPLWAGIALWHKMRTDKNFRAEENVYMMGASPALLDILAGVGKPKALQINRTRSFEWDRTLHKLRAQVGRNKGSEYLFQDELSGEELLHMEKALVRAYLDRLAYIPLSQNIKNETPFAYDLTSNCPLQMPDGAQKWQLDEEYCRGLDRLPNGQRPPGIFCFYTYLELEEDESGRSKWSAQDMTHVSWEAVYRVLSESKDSHGRQDLLSKIQTGQFLTR